MKLIKMILILLFCATLNASENLIQNSELKLDLQTGYPKYWRPKKGAAAECVEMSKGSYALQLSGSEENKRIWWIQNLTKIEKGKSYKFKVRLKGDSGVKAFAYIECNSPWKTFASPKVKCNGNWQDISINFSYKEFNRAPYLVLCLIGKGKVFFTDPVLNENVPSLELLKNTEFDTLGADGMPANWRLSKGATGSRIKQDGAYMLQLKNTDKKQRSYWAQHAVKKVEAGTEYIMSVDFKGTPGTLFRGYIESNSPWKTIGPRNIKCNGKWQKVNFKFGFTELNKPPYTIFRLTGAGELVFKNPSIVKASKDTNYTFSDDFSGWDFNNGEVADMHGDHKNTIKLSTTDDKAFAVYENLQLESGKSYLLTYQVKGGSDLKYLDSQGATWFRAMPLINGKAIKDKDEWLDVFKSWQTKNLLFKVPASKNKIVSAELICELKGKGTVFFDNISVKQVKASDQILQVLLDPPFSYRNSYYSSQKGVNELSGVILSQMSGVEKYEILFNGKAYTVKSTIPETAFKLPLPKTPGVYLLTVKAQKADNKKVSETSIDFTVQKPYEREITFRKDHVMLINNKPFFPLGVWTVYGPKSFKEKMKRISEAGFNTSLCDADQLDILATNGLIGLVRIIEKVPTFSDKQKLNKWIEFYTKEMNKLMKNPYLGGYFIIDEPAWRGVPAKPIIEAYKLIREIDPYRPVLLNEAPRGKVENIREYSFACDTYGVDIYPVPSPNSHSGMKDKMMTCVGRYTDKSKETVWDRKPIWMTLQAFSWKAILQKPKPFRYPTHHESRFMAYNAIVHGATGLFWWGINRRNENWDFVSELGKLIKELRAFSTVLVSETKADTSFKSSRSELAVLHKVHDNKNYYIVVNESGKDFSASLKGIDAKSLKVLFEDREISRKGDSFKDEFSAYDVNIYTDADKLPAPLPSPVEGFKPAKEFKSTDDFKEANWIWYPGKNKTPKHHAKFIRDLEVDADLAKAELFITADDFFKCYVNGELTVEHNHNNRGFSTVSYIDITSKLKPGKNRIAIHAADSGYAPCGMLYALRITDKNGKVSRIISDKETLTSETADANWLEKDFKPGKNWKYSQVIGKYGCQPWSFRSEAKPADNSLLGEFDL